MRSISTLATLLLGLALSFSPANAKELFDKPLDNTLAGLSSSSNGPTGTRRQQIADEFYLSRTSVISRVVWIGFYVGVVGDPIPPETTFDIMLFDDETELPEVPAFYFDAVKAKREITGLSTPFSGLPIFKFTAKLPGVPELEPGDYWLSITDNSQFLFAWSSSAEDPTDKLVLRHFDNEEFTTLTNSGRQNQAFTLHGKQIAEEITICHKRRTVTISEKLLPKHLRHGDTIGVC